VVRASPKTADQARESEPQKEGVQKPMRERGPRTVWGKTRIKKGDKSRQRTDTEPRRASVVHKKRIDPVRGKSNCLGKGEKATNKIYQGSRGEEKKRVKNLKKMEK